MPSSRRSGLEPIALCSLAFFLTACLASNPARENDSKAELAELQAREEASRTAPEFSIAPDAETGADDPALSGRPLEYPVGKRPTPVLPEGMTAIVAPAIVSEPAALYTSELPLPLGQEDIVASDVPKPANPNPKGRGFPADQANGIGPTLAPGARVESDGGLEGRIESELPSPLAPPFVSTFDSTDFDDNPGLSGSFFIPPDPHAAAGVNHLVNVVNTTIRFHTKDGATTFHAGLASFFAPLTPLTATFDPKVIYDQFEDRFVVVTLEQTDVFFGDPADTSRILIAVSDDGDPNGAWTLASIPVVIASTPTCAFAVWADYPGFAVDEDAVYITNNLFGFFSFGAPFCGTRLWIVDKGVIGGFYGGGAAAVSLFDPYAGAGVATTTQPAHVFCSPGTTCPAPEGTYMVSYSGLTNGVTEFVQSVRVDSPLGGTSFSQQFLAIADLETNPLPALPSAPQSGSTFPIATNSRRALNAVWRDDDSLWMTTTIGPNATTSVHDVGESTAFWLELDTTVLGAITLTQFGAVSGDPCSLVPTPDGCGVAMDAHTFFPSLAVNSANEVAIGFSASAPSIFAGSYYTTRVVSDPAGFTEPVVALRAGLDTYERTFDSIGGCSEVDSRWGDYSGISVDPANECFWVYNEHALARGTLLSGVCGVLPPLGAEDGRWGTAYGQACLCASTLALPMGVPFGSGWEQISMPCDPGPADTVAEVVGDDLAGVYGTDWIMYRRDEATTSYVTLTPTDALAVGEGYWIKTLLAAQSVSIGGKVNTLTDIPLTGVVAAPPAGCASSAGQCNKVGHPHSFDVCWADVLVDDGGPLSLAAADPGGICQTTGGATCIMSRIAHKWTGASYAPFDGATPGMEGTLVPWDGFWVSANKAGIELRVPATPGGPGLPCGPPAATVDGWYGRLIVESGTLEDRSNVFGELSDSVDGYDNHDLQELPPFGDSFLTVVFPHSEWGAQAGDYSSDFRELGASRTQSWHFQVRSADGQADVVLRWEVPPSQLRRSMLIDLGSDEEIVPAPDGSYAFTMEGPRRDFAWVVR